MLSSTSHSLYHSSSLLRVESCACTATTDCWEFNDCFFSLTILIILIHAEILEDLEQAAADDPAFTAPVGGGSAGAAVGTDAESTMEDGKGMNGR